MEITPKVKFIVTQTSSDPTDPSSSDGDKPPFQFTANGQVACNHCDWVGSLGPEMALHWKEETKRLTQQESETQEETPDNKDDKTFEEDIDTESESDSSLADNVTEMLEHKLDTIEDPSDEENEDDMDNEEDEHNTEDDVKAEISEYESDEQISINNMKEETCEVEEEEDEGKCKEERKRYACDSCSYIGTDKALYYHKQSIHLGITHNCGLCDFKATRKFALRRHEEKKHLLFQPKKEDVENGESSKDTKFPCESCPYIGNRKALYYHRKTIHLGVKYPCDVCKFTATRKYYLRRHMEKHLAEGEISEERLYNFPLNEESTGEIIKNEYSSFKVKKEEDSDGDPDFSKSLKVEIKHPCEFCPYQGNRNSLLLHHKSVHLGIRYPCDQCDFKATRKTGLKRHKLLHAEQIVGEDGVIKSDFAYGLSKEKYPCEECSYWGTLNALKLHRKSVHLGVRYPCDECDYKATAKHTLRRHKDKHLLENEFIDPDEKAAAFLRYEESKRVAREQRKVAYHMTKEKEMDSSNHVPCTQCGDMWPPSKMKAHMRTEHSSEKPYVCDKCGYATKHHSSLASHRRTVHTERPMLQCDKCENTFKSKEGLMIHMKLKHEENAELLQCDKCDFKHVRLSGLTSHKNTVHKEGEKHYCELCPYSSYSKALLKSHMDGPHSDIKLLECNECGYRAKKQQQLQNHININHLGIRFQCDYCDYQATIKQTLKEHVRAKHEGLKYNCEFCSFTASFKSNLGAHVRNTHPKLNNSRDIIPADNHVYNGNL